MTESEVLQISQERLSGVNPELAKAAWQVLMAARQRGSLLIVAEGYRSNERQNQLYAQGRSKPGNIVTGLRGGQSKHNFGEAVDFDFVVNGRQSNDLSNSWALVGSLGKELGLIWGGDWKSLKDYRHLEMPKNYRMPNINSASSNLPVGSQMQLQSQFSTTQIILGMLLIALILD